MATIVVPDALLEAAERAASSFGSTAERKTLKALRDVTKRRARADGLNYAPCPRCRGLALESPPDDADLHCLECAAAFDLEE